MPAFCLFPGALMLGAYWIADGLAPFGIMAALGAVFLLGSRSEPLRASAGRVATSAGR